MIKCKLCSNEEYHGAIFCSECGSQIAFASNIHINTLVYPSKLGSTTLDLTETIPKHLLEERTFLLFVPETKRTIDIPDQAEFTVGRYIEGQVITPDVDLNQYEAWDKGISRLHATFRVDKEKNTVHVIDLGSANGSSVNGYEIPANSEVPLNHGDTLILGKFKMKVILPQDIT
jgi:pSer/pThr/pTyr-binding forkhead associated (FHA) protein